jgi:hypothetical protein
MMDGEQGSHRSLVGVLRHLARDNETVELQLVANGSTMFGKLVAAETAYVTLVTDGSGCQGEGGSAHVKVYFIPVHKIVAVSER